MKMAKKFNMNKVSGSDAHALNILGKYACDIKGSSIDDVVKAIRKGNVKLPNANTSASRIFATQVARKFYTKLGLHR